ncbi:protein of unknown function [Caballeronia sp. S22]
MPSRAQRHADRRGELHARAHRVGGARAVGYAARAHQPCSRRYAPRRELGIGARADRLRRAVLLCLRAARGGHRRAAAVRRGAGDDDRLRHRDRRTSRRDAMARLAARARRTRVARAAGPRRARSVFVGADDRGGRRLGRLLAARTRPVRPRRRNGRQLRACAALRARRVGARVAVRELRRPGLDLRRRIGRADLGARLRHLVRGVERSEARDGCHGATERARDRGGGRRAFAGRAADRAARCERGRDTRRHRARRVGETALTECGARSTLEISPRAYVRDLTYARELPLKNDACTVHQIGAGMKNAAIVAELASPSRRAMR